MHRHPKSREEFEDQIRSHDVLFPDPVGNANNVDKLLWRGSPNASLVQRIGMGLIGGFFLLASGLIYHASRREPSYFGGLVALGLLYLGGGS